MNIAEQCQDNDYFVFVCDSWWHPVFFPSPKMYFSYRSLGKLEEMESFGRSSWHILVTFAGIIYYEFRWCFWAGFTVFTVNKNGFTVSIMMKIVGSPRPQAESQRIRRRSGSSWSHLDFLKSQQIRTVPIIFLLFWYIKKKRFVKGDKRRASEGRESPVKEGFLPLDKDNVHFWSVLVNQCKYSMDYIQIQYIFIWTKKSWGSCVLFCFLRMRSCPW